MADTAERSYISLKPCGCLSMAVMERAAEAPRMVAEAIRHGEMVERVTAEHVRTMPWRCADHPVPPKPEKQEAML